MSLDKKVVLKSEVENYVIEVEGWQDSTVSIAYEDLEIPESRIEMHAMDKEEFKALVDSVNYIMGWDV